MNAAPFITIIIPTYNSENEIEGILYSIKNQSFLSHEIVIIDGKSTDNTLKIIKENNHLISTWISEPDQGLYDAMNKGIKLAKGKYLCFLGADDTIEKDAFKEIERVASSTNADLIYGLAKNKLQNKIYGKKYNLESLTVPGKVMPHGAVFYRRDLLEKIGYFDLEYPIAADVIFNIKAFSKAQNPVFINKVLYSFSGEGVSKDAIDTNFYQNIQRELTTIQQHIQDASTKASLEINKKFYSILNQIIFKNYFIGVVELLFNCLRYRDFSYLKHALYHLRIRLFNKRKLI